MRIQVGHLVTVRDDFYTVTSIQSGTVILVNSAGYMVSVSRARVQEPVSEGGRAILARQRYRVTQVKHKEVMIVDDMGMVHTLARSAIVSVHAPSMLS